MDKNADYRVTVRMAAPLSEALFKIICSRYPDGEWGSFIRMGFHETSHGLILTLTGIDEPTPGDIDPESWITEIQAEYTSRMLHFTETHPFAVGFVHSHPQNFNTGPSPSDYAMEEYYANLLIPYTSCKPFASLIFAVSATGEMSATGRVFWRHQWSAVDKFIVENKRVSIYNYEKASNLSKEALSSVERLASQFSTEAADDLAGSTVGIVGASGTGSPCIELLARAGVGKLVIIDPEIFEASNLERIHGSSYADIAKKTPKVIIAGQHVKSINPACEIVLIKGRIPQAEVVDELLTCDIVLGCTDLHSARVALSDLSLRYLVPVIDVGVIMEGKNGNITGQVIQLNRLFPGDPCVYCRSMVDSKIVSQELMPPAEQAKYKKEAVKAQKEGRDSKLYWIDTPQLNTVGYLTTLAGSMVVSYTIGYLTGRFKMTASRIEMNLSPHGIQVTELDEACDPECRCHKNAGVADQDCMAIMSSSPDHWPKAYYLSADKCIL